MMKQRKNKIILFVFIAIIIVITFYILLIKNKRETIYTGELVNSVFENTSDFNISNESYPNKIENMEITNTITISSSPPISTKEESPTKNNKQINTSTTHIKSNTPKQNREEPKQDITKNEIKNNTADSNSNNKTNNNNSANTENTIKNNITNNATDDSRPELANTTYRKGNTSIVREIINILKSEINNDKELVEYGSTALQGNKADAYNKTSAFTYLFVKDINRGKVSGNYISFPDRVKNNVGAFGNYFVYAEDEYVYDGRGLNPKWSQTLVWIYVTF